MKILGMGTPELLIILVVVLLIFGPKNLPKLGKNRAWVDSVLQDYACRARDVYLLSCEPGGKLYLSIREDAT